MENSMTERQIRAVFNMAAIELASDFMERQINDGFVAHLPMLDIAEPDMIALRMSADYAEFHSRLVKLLDIEVARP
jgi:hypothetical protein